MQYLYDSAVDIYVQSFLLSSVTAQPLHTGVFLASSGALYVSKSQHWSGARPFFSFHLFQCRCVTTVVMNHYNIIDATHAMLSTHATTKQQTNNQTNNRRGPLQPLTLC